jgi:hypothetical protein
MYFEYGTRYLQTKTDSTFLFVYAVPCLCKKSVRYFVAKPSLQEMQRIEIEIKWNFPCEQIAIFT